MNVQNKLDSLLLKVEKPARYIGTEPYSVSKDTSEDLLRFAFCFPDTYEIGMSYMGMQILYNILNKCEDIYCERCFAPELDMAEEMRKAECPLFTLETKTPLGEMDIVGFTLQYELSYTNILFMLDLAGIPARAADRDESMPLIIAGGPCAFNAEPLADFFDAILIGDGEIQLPELCHIVKDFKAQGRSKSEILNKISEIPGVYIPSFYAVKYAENGDFAEIETVKAGAPKQILKYIADDVDALDFPMQTIVPFIEVVHDRAVAEIFRGCTRGCRFCQAGMLYRPVRERSMENVIKYAKSQLEKSGNEELSLLSLSTSDYTQFEPLVLNLMDYCQERQISLSLPSLRLDNFSFGIIDKIQGVRKSGLTFAPEAGTQRLRDVINKNITEKDILHSVNQALDMGWTLLKLYFMIGLPTETDEDLQGIADLTEKIMQLAKSKNTESARRFRISVSVSNFVPKPFTPFQWAPQDSPEEFERKHYFIKDRLKKIKGVTYHYHGSFGSSLEAVFARGGRELSKLLECAYKKGCCFDAWTEHFNAEAWTQALEECGINADYQALAGFNTDAPLPWDHISCGVDKEYLISEYEKAIKETTTPDCRYGCNGCGLNKHTECRWGNIYEQVRS